ncbi:MAG: DUF1993 domain-containing protein [Hyphomicrobiaceae bacterium]|nr:MAG: DUF1993 domain-containing protein [Hyphomicrobiaceae bacterium]
MSLSMYQASVPVFVQILTALSTVLDKAQAHAAARKIDPGVLLAARLAPDMFPLTSQVQIACDFAKGAATRLAGAKVPSWPDNEKSFADLGERISKTIDFVQAFKPAQIDGSEARDVTISVAGQAVTFKGRPYLIHYVMPNFYFHATVAYAILRHNGVELGKRNFVGKVPGMSS